MERGGREEARVVVVVVTVEVAGHETSYAPSPGLDPHVSCLGQQTSVETTQRLPLVLARGPRGRLEPGHAALGHESKLDPPIQYPEDNTHTIP